jgi:outer membrane receptor protein involved in Fe transport
MKYFLLFFTLFSSSVFAQNTGKISGTVKDITTKEAIPGAHVIIKGTKLGSSTGFDGTFFILNIPPGEYEVAASIVGFQTVVQQQVIVNVSRTTNLDFMLIQTPVDLPEMMIVAKRPDVEEDKTTSSLIVRPEEMQAIPQIQNLTDLLALSSDVTDGHFRGGREGEELYNIQGMSVVNPLNSTSAFTPMVSALEEVEIITSGFGAQYGNAQSGVVNISMKEAQGDRWRSRAEFRSRIPGLKHFGKSVYDSSANPYLKLLDSPEKWLGADISSTEGQRYYSTIGNGFDSRYGLDTITLSQIAYTLWMKQGRRDLNKRYDNLMDYTADVTIGGPVSQNGRLFLATRLENEWPIIPTDEPDVKRQIMGNLVQDLGKGMALRFLGTYTNDRKHVFRSYRTNGLLNWIWDRALGLSYAREENLQLGVRFSHTLSDNTFYDLKLSRLSTIYSDGSPVTEPSGYSGDYSKIIWGKYDKTPDQFNVGAIDDDYRREKTSTLSFDGSITSQVTNDHQIMAGLQANYYTIDVSNRTNIRSDETERNEFYNAKPFEVGIYGQDKMEFEGMIANVGIRWDLWNQNVEYYKDLFSPFRYYTNDSGMFVYDKNKAPREKTPTLGRLQPRIGISFPITTFTVFHLNYGAFVQRPSFERTISSQLPRIGFARMQIGNPRLLPQETDSYDVGITQGFGDGFTIDVSGYYKDVKNLIQRAFFYDVTQTMYSTFINRDYADIRGFRIAIAKREGFITGSFNYTYGVATGKSSTPFNASPIYRENPPKGVLSKELPDPKDILMDFDRTHNLIVNLAINSGESWGPEFGGVKPLEQITIGLNSFARSGRPYTYTRAGEKELLVNNKRTPAEYNTKLKISKKIQRLFGTTATFYVEINNLFDSRIYSYSGIFQSATAATGGSYINRNLTKYEENRDMLHYFDDFAPFLADQTFILYDNMPRSINIGLVLNM